MDNANILIEFTGNTDDLFVDKGIIRQTRLINDFDDYKQNFDIAITSYDESLEHEQFNKLLGRKIKVTIETADEK